jgi:hypothetical protein
MQGGRPRCTFSSADGTQRIGTRRKQREKGWLKRREEKADVVEFALGDSGGRRKEWRRSE